MSSKFIPKYPARNVMGRNRIVTNVSCFMLSFWYAPMVLKMSEIMRSADRRMRSSDDSTTMQWSSTSPKYVCASVVMVMEPVEGSLGASGGGELAIEEEEEGEGALRRAVELWWRRALTRPEMGAIWERRRESSEVRM